jgi:hypothetical protein
VSECVCMRGRGCVNEGVREGARGEGVRGEGVRGGGVRV